MRYYELLYIVNPNLEDERVNGIIEEIGNELSKYKVNIINHHIWGKKRLAFPIKNNKYGIYILLQFEAEQFDFLKEFERYLILSKAVIRHQIVKLDNEPKKVEGIEIEDEEAEVTEDEVFDLPESESDIEDVDDDMVEDVKESETGKDMEDKEEAAVTDEKGESGDEEDKQEEGKE